jgi:uncharacterized protein
MPAAKINPATLAFDIDGVIADTMTLFLEIARDEFDIHDIHYRDITCYNLEDCIDIEPETIDRIVTRVLDGDFAAALKPIPGAPEVLTRLARYSDPILCVTARPQAERVREWIRGILPLASAAVAVVATGSFEAKTDVLIQRKVTHFVEDRLETCFNLSAAGISPIVFIQPWNREPHPFLEVSSWEELSNLIQW